MARPIWKGHISFGLVHIPVTLYAAEQRNDIQLKLVDGRNNAGIRYERVNEVTGEEVPWGEIVKGYEYDDGRFILLTEDDLKQAAPEKTQTIDIEAFVPAGSIEPQYFDKPYYLVPQKNSDKAYALLREALVKTQRLGIARVVIRTRQYLAAISARETAIMLDLLRFHQELRRAPEEKLPGFDLDRLKISSKELELATQLIDAMSTDWTPETYRDEYRERLMDWIERKASTDGTTAIAGNDDEEVGAATNVIDMMALLQASMKSRAEAEPQEAPPKKRSRRKSS